MEELLRLSKDPSMCHVDVTERAFFYSEKTILSRSSVNGFEALAGDVSHSHWRLHILSLPYNLLGLNIV